MKNKEYAIFDNEIKAKGDDSRVLTFIGSTETRDRMGDEIKVTGWDVKNFRKNPVFLWAHNYNEPPIGRAKSVKRDKERNALVFDIEFAPAEANPKAEQVYQLYKQGFMSATSVGFMSHKSEWIEDEGEDGDGEKDNSTPDLKPGKRFKKQELLELSAVPVPANPEALIQARSAGEVELPRELERMYQQHMFKMQQKEADRAADELANEPDARELDNVETKPGWDEAENEYRYRVRDPGRFQDNSFRRKVIQKSPLVAGIFGKLTGETTMTLQSLRFPKKQWSLTDAKAWLKDHDDILKTIIPDMLLCQLEDAGNVETAASDSGQLGTRDIAQSGSEQDEATPCDDGPEQTRQTAEPEPDKPAERRYRILKRVQ